MKVQEPAAFEHINRGGEFECGFSRRDRRRDWAHLHFDDAEMLEETRRVSGRV